MTATLPMWKYSFRYKVVEKFLWTKFPDRDSIIEESPKTIADVADAKSYIWNVKSVGPMNWIDILIIICTCFLPKVGHKYSFPENLVTIFLTD